MSRATGELGDAVRSYATTNSLVGDGVVCASCGHLDHAARFVAEDLPVCEDCEARSPGGSEESETWLPEDR